VKPRFVLASFATLIALTAAPAIAADMRMPVKAPPAPIVTVFSWTGCYVGANIGYGRADKDYFDPIEAVNVGSHKADGIVGGGQVGCDYQAGNWVFGIQGMFDAADLTGSHVNPFPYFGIPNDFTEHTRVSWFTTVTGRLGYTLQPSLLAYVKGGAAWVRDKHQEFRITPDPTFVPGSASVTRTGWVIGGGFEYSFGRNWSVFAEYNYLDFGRKTVTLDYGPTGTYDFDIKQQVHLGLVGINYRFGGFGGPVVAQY
jgi:outer membrane immunogenic protein